MIEPHTSEILLKLEEIGHRADSEIDVFETALLIASLDHPGRLIERYALHRDRVVNACQALYQEKAELSAQSQLDVLREILVNQEEYSGDTQSYDRLDNADLMSVIDRRCGLPVSLAIIYLSVCADLGWHVEALSFPAHVFLRIEYQGERIIFDPFDDMKVMEAHDLRHKLKALIGDHVELSAAYYDAMSTRDVIIRLQNNIKTRLISGEDYDAALQRIDVMRLIVPDDPRLLFESGVLNARSGKRKRAIDLLYRYIDVAPTHDDKEEAFSLLKELEESLN